MKIKGFFKTIKSRIVLILSMVFSFTMLGYFITSNFICDISLNVYSVEARYDSLILFPDELISKEELESVKQMIIDIRQEALDKGEKAPYSDFSYVDINSLSNGGLILEVYEDYYKISVLKEEFKSLAQARRFIKGLFENKNVIEDNNVYYNDPVCVEENIIYWDNLIWTISISLVCSFILVISILFIIYVTKPSWFNDKYDYDNIILYKNPFKKELFKSSFKNFSNIKAIVMISILFALQMALKQISIPTGLPNLNINLGTLIFPIISMIFGPIPAISIGALSDIIGFMVKPNGPFFPGYTLSAMISGLIYALCLYKTKITFTKCLTARLLIGVLVNAFLGSLWTKIVMGIDYNLSLSISLFKNLLFLFPQSLIMFLSIKVLAPVFERTKFIKKELLESISVF